jgi:phytoene synthase
MLYAWCRYCDDQIDSQSLGFASESDGSSPSAVLDSLRRETRRALAGEPVDNPAFVAFQRVVQHHGIPDRYPLELLDGFAMDVEHHGYHTLDDTLLYCYHVAGVVGVMMAYVMGVKGGDALLRACDLGIAFQLTNISRDVMDDARMDRVYLPADWLKAAGVPPNGIMEAKNRPGVFAVVQRLLAEADRYYDSAMEGLPSLGWRAAWGIATARYVYRHIGRLVKRRGSAAWDKRAVVGGGRKLFGACYGLLLSFRACSLGRMLPRRQRGGLWTKLTQEDI